MTLAILTQVICLLPRCLQANAGIVHQLSHDCFFPNPFQFVIQPRLYYLMLHSLATDSAVKFPPTPKYNI
jgi:hypothetical protein